MVKRLRLKTRARIKVEVKPRTKDYLALRFYWLHELCQLRAKRRNGTAAIRDIKAAQRNLAKIRDNF